MAVQDLMGGKDTQLDSPSAGGQAIVADVDFAYASRGIYVGGDGNMTVVMLGGQSLTFTAVKAGSILPIRATKVLSSSLTASNLVALY